MSIFVKDPRKRALSRIKKGGDFEPLSVNLLKRMGFKKDGWGSPQTRKEKNTTVYEKIIVSDKPNKYWNTLDIIYFPNNWEGYHTKCDPRGHFMIYNSSKTYKVPILCKHDLTSFIDKIKCGDNSIEKFRCRF